MTKPVQQVRKPQIGEWWEVEQGMGYRAKYCQIYSISQADDDSFFAKMIIEDDYLPFGFKVILDLIHKSYLTKPSGSWTLFHSGRKSSGNLWQSSQKAFPRGT